MTRKENSDSQPEVDANRKKQQSARTQEQTSASGWHWNFESHTQADLHAGASVRTSCCSVSSSVLERRDWNSNHGRDASSASDCGAAATRSGAAGLVTTIQVCTASPLHPQSDQASSRSRRDRPGVAGRPGRRPAASPSLSPGHGPGGPQPESDSDPEEPSAPTRSRRRTRQ